MSRMRRSFVICAFPVKRSAALGWRGGWRWCKGLRRRRWSYVMMKFLLELQPLRQQPKAYLRFSFWEGSLLAYPFIPSPPSCLLFSLPYQWGFGVLSLLPRKLAILNALCAFSYGGPFLPQWFFLSRYYETANSLLRVNYLVITR